MRTSCSGDIASDMRGEILIMIRFLRSYKLLEIERALYGKMRTFLGPIVRELAGQRGSTIVAGHMVQDHVHMLIRIPPKYAVAEVIGSSKGKSAIGVARQFGGRQRTFHGERFWARGYAVSTMGFEEEQMRASIKHQEPLDTQGSEEPGEFSLRHTGPWQPLGLLTTVKPPALRGRYDFAIPLFPSNAVDSQHERSLLGPNRSRKCSESPLIISIVRP